MAGRRHKTYRRTARISDQCPHRQGRGPNRFPPVGGEHVVLVHQIAHALGWSTARIRGVDDVLKPIRMADGTRAYDVDRALFFIRIFDELAAIVRAREAKERAHLRPLARLGKRPT